jgi:hypothetical protein
VGRHRAVNELSFERLVEYVLEVFQQQPCCIESIDEARNWPLHCERFTFFFDSKLVEDVQGKFAHEIVSAAHERTIVQKCPINRIANTDYQVFSLRSSKNPLTRIINFVQIMRQENT